MPSHVSTDSFAIATHSPTAGLGLASVLLLVTVWPRKMDVGPDLRKLYDEFGGGSPLDVGQRMFSELLKAIEGNARAVNNVGLKLGFAIMAVSLIGCLIVGLLR